MEQPHGFTFNDHTGDDPDDEEFDKAMYDQWLNREIVIDDPEQIERIQSLVRVEERDGRRVLVVKPNALDEALDQYDIDPDDDDPTPFGYDPDDDEDVFDDDGLPVGLARFLNDDAWARLDWNEPEGLPGVAAFVAHSLTPAMLQLMDEVGATSSDNPEPELTQALAALGVIGAAGMASDITIGAYLGCRLNHMREDHSKKELKAWRSRAAQALGAYDWDELVEDHPNIEAFAAAFRRFNDADCRMNQLVHLEDSMWDVRIIATDGEGGYRLALADPEPDNDDEDGEVES